MKTFFVLLIGLLTYAIFCALCDQSQDWQKQLTTLESKRKTVQICEGECGTVYYWEVEIDGAKYLATPTRGGFALCPKVK